MNISTDAFKMEENSVSKSYLRIRLYFLIKKKQWVEKLAVKGVAARKIARLLLKELLNAFSRPKFFYRLIQILLELNGSFDKYLKLLYHEKSQR